MSFYSSLYTTVFTIGLFWGILVTFLVWSFHLLGLSYSLYKFHRKTSKASTNSKELPGISIIKPLTDVDSNLEKNLETFFRLNYPCYELLFCIQQHNQRLLAIIERLRAHYSHVTVQIFIGSNCNTEQIFEKDTDEDLQDPVDDDQTLLIRETSRKSFRQKSIPLWKRVVSCGKEKSITKDRCPKTSGDGEIKNPKIGNMLSAYNNAQYSLILISDSGMTMCEDTLYDMYALMADDVGLVHQMPFTCDKAGFAGSLEKVYFGTQHARMYMTINFVGINCVTGMSCLIRKQCLDKVGGLKAFGDYIAEDYYIAYEVAKQGWKLRVASAPALQNSGDCSIKRWTERMIRWCKLRMRLSPLAYLEPFQECLLSGILAGLVTNYLFNWNTLVITACHVLVWFILDYCMLRITQGGPLPFRKFEFAVVWLTRELIIYYIYFKAFTGSSTIEWRGKKYRLGSGTRAELIDLPSAQKPLPSVPSLRIESPTTTPSYPVNESNALSV